MSVMAIVIARLRGERFSHGARIRVFCPACLHGYLIRVNDADQACGSAASGSRPAGLSALAFPTQR
ncbi:protein of unknown function [Burkholderia multivorans]